MAFESSQVNVKNLYYTIMTKEDTAVSPPEYDNPEYLGDSVTITVTPNSQNVPAYANGTIVEVYTGNTGGTIALNIYALKASVDQKLFGSVYDQNGVLISSAEDVSPYIALLYQGEKQNGKVRYECLYKTKLQAPARTYSTKTDTVTFQQPTINGSYLPRMDEAFKVANKSRSVITACIDEDDPNYNAEIAEGWYKKVYEPTAPDANP